MKNEYFFIFIKKRDIVHNKNAKKAGRSTETKGAFSSYFFYSSYFIHLSLIFEAYFSAILSSVITQTVILKEKKTFVLDSSALH